MEKRLFEVIEPFMISSGSGRKTINRLLRKGDYIYLSEVEGDANPHLKKVSKNAEEHYREQGTKTGGKVVH